MKTSNNLWYWLPRILAILAIGFVSLFALDAFNGNESLLIKVQHYVMHMIPSLILAGILALSWKWERLGGSIYILLGAGLIPFIYSLNHNRNGFSTAQSLNVVLLINLPFILVGILFWISYKYGHKTQVSK